MKAARVPTPVEQVLIDAITPMRASTEQFLTLARKVEAHIAATEKANRDAGVDVDQQARWVRLALEDFQAGLTKLERAVNEPRIDRSGKA